MQKDLFTWVRYFRQNNVHKNYNNLNAYIHGRAAENTTRRTAEV